MAWLWFAAMTNIASWRAHQVPILGLPESSQYPGRWACNHPGRSEDIERGICTHPFSYQTIGTRDPKKLESFKKPHSGEGKGRGARQRKACLSKSCCSVLTTYSSKETGVQTMTQWPHLNHDCLAMHTPCLLFKPKPHGMTLNLDSRGSLDLFVVLVNVFIVHQISFFCLSILLCLFSWLFGDRWASLVCEGCYALMSLLQDLLFSNGDLVVEAQTTVSETLRAK